MIQKLKKPASIAAMIGILLGIGIIAFAARTFWPVPSSTKGPHR